jgi:hypothetical protein
MGLSSALSAGKLKPMLWREGSEAEQGRPCRDYFELTNFNTVSMNQALEIPLGS